MSTVNTSMTTTSRTLTSLRSQRAPRCSSPVPVVTTAIRRSGAGAVEVVEHLRIRVVHGVLAEHGVEVPVARDHVPGVAAVVVAEVVDQGVVRGLGRFERPHLVLRALDE